MMSSRYPTHVASGEEAYTLYLHLLMVVLPPVTLRRGGWDGVGVFYTLRVDAAWSMMCLPQSSVGPNLPN